MRNVVIPKHFYRRKVSFLFYYRLYTCSGRWRDLQQLTSVCLSPHRSSAATTAWLSRGFCGRATTCTSNAAGRRFDSHTARTNTQTRLFCDYVHFRANEDVNNRRVRGCLYLEGEAASGVVFTLPDTVHQHFNLPVDSSLLWPVQNTLLHRGSHIKAVNYGKIYSEFDDTIKTIGGNVSPE